MQCLIQSGQANKQANTHTHKQQLSFNNIYIIKTQLLFVCVFVCLCVCLFVCPDCTKEMEE